MTTNFIYQFFEDPQENFWFMSNSGILRVGKKELNQLADRRVGGVEQLNCTSFGIPDGMKSIEFNNELSRHSALKTKKGELWFITKKGITIVNPGTIQINKLPPPVVIEAVLFDEQPIPLRLDAEAYGFKGIMDFQFYFTALTFISPEKIKFKYRLEGIDREWRYLPAGKERSARYKDLEPGTYTFRVIASNSDGIWNQIGDSMTFTLKPFFYETILFKAFIVIMLIALLAAAFYIYKKRPFDKRVKYKGATLNPQFAEVCIQKLKHLMEAKKMYRDPDISLQLLAEKMSITSHVLSQLLNEKLNRNFSDFINFYRIEEAKRILQSPKAEEQKIITVAFDVGFNTKVAFYNAFKKYTNMTPSEYRKKAGSEE
jgi:AraC-like DNA-binding protein